MYVLPTVILNPVTLHPFVVMYANVMEVGEKLTKCDDPQLF